jgi:aromatic-L-amino-acid decarboxylase
MSDISPAVDGFGDYFARVGRAVDEWLASGPPDALATGVPWRDLLAGPVPEEGVGAQQALDEYLRLLLPHGSRLSTPTFWGWIATGPTTLPTAVAAATMVVAPGRVTFTAFNHVEELSLQWLAEVFGLGERMRGVYSSGGSTANLLALGAARQWALEQAGIDAAASGLDGRPLAIYASTQAHRTIQRAAGVLGIGRDRVREVGVDSRMRLDLADLRRALRRDLAAGVLPVAVVATVGTTNTGTIDPLRGAADIAAESGAWLHVDGAYGLPGILDERVRPLYDGLELADSVITDPHKWMGAPVGIAATFVRDRTILERAFRQDPADYLEGSFAAEEIVSSLDSRGIRYDNLGVELTSPPRGVAVWAILRELGVAGLRRRIVADNDLARHLADRITGHPRLQLVAEPVLSICPFRYRTDAAADWDQINARILRRMVRETPLVTSSTRVDGAFVLRACFINVRTTREHVDELVETVARLGDEEASG